MQREEVIVVMVSLILGRNAIAEASMNVTIIAVIQLHAVLNKKPNAPRVNVVMSILVR